VSAQQRERHNTLQVCAEFCLSGSWPTFLLFCLSLPSHLCCVSCARRWCECLVPRAVVMGTKKRLVTHHWQQDWWLSWVSSSVLSEPLTCKVPCWFLASFANFAEIGNNLGAWLTFVEELPQFTWTCTSGVGMDMYIFLLISSAMLYAVDVLGLIQQASLVKHLH